jgi:AraC-like DNA-binding protein
MNETATEPAAYTVYQAFDAAPAQVFQVDRHYLLYATRGALRLEAEGRVWSLPPARAALIAANAPITVTLPQAVTICSVLFRRGFLEQPKHKLSVFDMSPLARELVLECRHWGPASGPLSGHAERLFDTLGAVVLLLADTPSPTHMPVPRSTALGRAIALTEARLAEDPQLSDIAKAVALTPRTLARRFADEMGMTWRQATRRLRMIRAIEILAEGDAPVTEVALSVGYASPSAFNAAFLDFTGQTPTGYRDSFRTAPPT